jgi:hypothetical protein
MQTLQFTRALRLIVTKLKVKELIEFLAPYLNGPASTAITQAMKDNFSTLILESNTGFSQLASDPDVKRILDTLKIAEVYAAPRMGKLLGAFSVAAGSNVIWGTSENFNQFFSFVDMLRWLEKLSSGSILLLETERVQRTIPGEVVEFEIIDYDGKGVEAERLKRFFSSLIELHSQLARFLKIEGAHLEVAYVDSGSILVGVATAVGITTALKNLLVEIWKEIRYGPFERLDRKTESLDKVLTITKKIDEQIESKTLPEELGKNMKHRILTEALALIEVGAMIPARNPTEEKEQRKLLAERRIKLLGSGDGPPGEESGVSRNG